MHVPHAMETTNQHFAHDRLEEGTTGLGKNWGWLLAAGLAFILFGVVAISWPIASTFGLAVALASVLAITGVLLMIQAVKMRFEHGAPMRFVHALLLLLTGGVIFFYPGIGMLGISVMLTAYFFLGAVVQWLAAQALAPDRARIWVYLNSLASFLLGIYMLFTFPVSVLWVPGMLLGIEFLIHGGGLIGLAWVVRKLYHGGTVLRTSHQPS